jgi:hypothetical protein
MLQEPKFSDSNPAEDDGLLRAIKISSTTSFGGVVKLSAPRHFYGTLKNPRSIPVGKIHGHFLPSFSLLCY